MVIAVGGIAVSVLVRTLVEGIETVGLPSRDAPVAALVAGLILGSGGCGRRRGHDGWRSADVCGGWSIERAWCCRCGCRDQACVWRFGCVDVIGFSFVLCCLLLTMALVVAVLPHLATVTRARATRAPMPRRPRRVTLHPWRLARARRRPHRSRWISPSCETWC